MEVRGQLHASAILLPRTNPGNHWIRGWNGSQKNSGRFRREKFFFCDDWNTGSFSP